MDGERDGAIHKQRDYEGQGMLKCMLPMKEMFFKCQPVPCWKRVSQRQSKSYLDMFHFPHLGRSQMTLLCGAKDKSKGGGRAGSEITF